MIMVADITTNNYTAQAAPSWKSVDNFGLLVSQNEPKRSNVLRRLAERFKTVR